MTERRRKTEPLKKTKLLIEACRTGGASALERVTKRFDQSPDPFTRLPYHDWGHSDRVGKNAVRILQSIGNVTPSIGLREYALATFIGNSHDTVQDWDQEIFADEDRTLIKRKRRTQHNEWRSLLEATEYMRATNRHQEDEVFSPTDLEDVVAGITVTIPCFDCDAQTVVQPQLNRDTPLVARAVALADLGTAGMDGGQAFLHTSLALFQEDNLDLVDMNLDRLNRSKQGWIRDRIFEWLENQIAFVDGRELRLDYELDGLTSEERDAVRGIFTRFDDSREVIEEFAKEAIALPFQELATAVGY